MEPQVLIFDLDGTLIDSRADLAAGVNHMRAHFGLAPLSVATVGCYVGNGTRLLVERALQGAAVDVEQAMQVNHDYYAAHGTVHTHLYDGVADGIRVLADAGHRLAVLTNKPGELSRAILQYFGIDRFFLRVVGGGDVAALKPDPSGIYACMETAKMTAEQTWMIGDNYTDLESARNAGVRSALVHYGFGDARGLESDQDFASFAELVRYFVGT